MRASINTPDALLYLILYDKISNCHRYSNKMPSSVSRLSLLVLAVGIRMIYTDEIANWALGLRALLKDCPEVPWNTSENQKFLDSFRHCMQNRAVVVLDTLLTDDTIPVFDGINLVRFEESDSNVTDVGSDRDGLNKSVEKEERESEKNLCDILINRLCRVFRTHVLKIDVDQLSNSIGISSGTSTVGKSDNAFEGRRRRHRRRHHMMPLMMMGFLLMGSILIPMGFQFLAVLGGKALILAKMALMLSSIQGLKKIATNGVNYGLYQSPVVEGWHERSHLEPPNHFDGPHHGYPSQPHP